MTVFDQGYQRWKGDFRPRKLRWLPMVRYQMALTLKRRIIWLILFLAIVPSLGFCGIIYFSSELAANFSPIPPGMTNPMSPEEPVSGLVEGVVAQIQDQRGIPDDPDMTRAEKYWIATCYAFYIFLMVPQSFVVLLVTSAVGAGLVAQDLKSNALEIYLTKPITPVDYILGKLAVITAFILLTTFLPLMMVFGAASLSLQGYFEVAWPIVPRLFLACILASFVNGIFILGLSSLAKSARYATIIWFALCLVSSLTSLVLADVTGDSNWVFLGYRNNFSFLIGELLGGNLMFDAFRGTAIKVNPFIPILILSAVVGFSIMIMRRTIRSVENR